MFKRILVPINLAHAETLESARKTANDLAQHYEASVVYASVTSSLPGSVAHTPEEFKSKLIALAAQDGEIYGVTPEVHVTVSHDPAADLEPNLLKTIDEEKADLVVMATHVPVHFWPSNGGRIASHANASVLLVRNG